MVMGLTALRLRLPFPYDYLWSLDIRTKGKKGIECSADGGLTQWEENRAERINGSLFN